MEKATMIAAIISGGLSAAAALLVAWKDEIKAILSPNKRDITGWWKGTGVDIDVPDYFGPNKRNLLYDVEVNLRQRGKRVTGEARISADMDFTVSLIGKFINDEYFYLEWRHQDKNIKGFGYTICNILDTGNQIEATTLFSRIRSEGIALNRVELEKT